MQEYKELLIRLGHSVVEMVELFSLLENMAITRTIYKRADVRCIVMRGLFFCVSFIHKTANFQFY